jgi:PhzF family phenazine biosynthesis protein
MGQSIIQVDAFTAQPFRGNPTAVCVLPGPRDEDWMQNVAREMNLSETAFLHPEKDGYQLRWFTPAVEVDLCGHATLTSAHVLWEMGHLSPDKQARFYTLSGLLTADRDGNWIELDFPAEPETAVEPPSNLIKALGIEPAYVGKNRVDYLVEVDSEETIRALTPDMGLLRTVPCRGVIVTSQAGVGSYDFVSRFFAPGVGIDEDPVTGSAHYCLGSFWATRLRTNSFRAYQASARGGVIQVQVDGERVRLGGQAVTVMRGELLEGSI